MSSSERKAAKVLVDQLMGEYAGHGLSPSEASNKVSLQLHIDLTPREAWNLWIDGDEN